jgi:hypothetical protein
MMSEENKIGRIEIIKKTQQEMYQMVQAMVMAGTLTPQVYAKMKKPYEDTLYALGVKDCEVYLPSDEEVLQMIQQGQQAAQQKGPPAADVALKAQADLLKAQSQLSQAKIGETQAKINETKAKTQEILANMTGESAERQLEAASLMIGKPRDFTG